MRSSRANWFSSRFLGALLGMIAVLSTACQSSSVGQTASPTVSSRGLPAAGRIAFQLAFGPNGDDSNLLTIKPDGTGLQTLTNVAPGQGRSGNPAWTPAGDRIFFDVDTRTADHLFWMSHDGGSISQLTAGPGFDGDPAITPDGTHIAFDRSGGPNPPPAAIFLMNADGSHVLRVTTPPASARDGDRNPDFSPDGKRLVFVRDGAIYVVFIDGSGLRQITPGSLHAARPRWSSDGSKILFGDSDQANASVGHNVHVVNVDGSGLRAVTDEPAADWAGDPTWSPDGSMIAFNEFRSEVHPHFVAIVVMRADGTNPVVIWHPVPNTDNFPETLAWGKES